jgi:hypothetical protein
MNEETFNHSCKAKKSSGWGLIRPDGPNHRAKMDRLINGKGVVIDGCRPPGEKGSLKCRKNESAGYPESGGYEKQQRFPM